MSKSKMIQYMKKFIYDTYVPSESSIIGRLKSKIWTAKLERMTEGDVIDTYYMLTGKKDGEWI